MDHRQLVKDLLQTTPYGTLATVSAEAKPWNSPVVIMHDDNLNFYWFSDHLAQHSRNIRDTGSVFIVIYDSTVALGKKLDRGVYIEAEARELSDPTDINHAQELLQKLVPGSPYELMGDRRVYRATPQRLWINDILKQNGRFVRDCRVEVPLAELKPFLKNPSGV